jgi:hypothetical protein
MKESVYIETTIVSYLVARPSWDLLLAAHQEVTREWWQNMRASYECFTSEETIREAGFGDVEMIEARMEKLRELIVVGINAEIEALASRFLSTGALPSTMLPDATHLAAATLAQADYLLTWNCKHLANAHVLKRLRQEAEKQGWVLPEVCTPLELMERSNP